MLKEHCGLSTCFKHIVHPVSSRLGLHTLWRLRYHAEFIRVERAVMSVEFGAVGYSMEGELVTIFCYDCVTLHRVTLPLYQLGLAI
jgi:hypothetical protein